MCIFSFQSHCPHLQPLQNAPHYPKITIMPLCIPNTRMFTSKYIRFCEALCITFDWIFQRFSFLHCCVWNVLSSQIVFQILAFPCARQTLKKLSFSFLILSWKMTLYYLHIHACHLPFTIYHFPFFLCLLFNPSLFLFFYIRFTWARACSVHNQWFRHCNVLQYTNVAMGKLFKMMEKYRHQQSFVHCKRRFC